MYHLKYHLHKRLITDLFNACVCEINNCNDSSKLNGIYNYYSFEFKSILNHLKFTCGGDKHDELVNLIKDYRKQMKQMISNVKEGDKHGQRN